MSINFDDKDGLDKGLLPMSKMNSNKSNIIIKEEEESNEKEGKTIYESKQAKSKYYSTGEVHIVYERIQHVTMPITAKAKPIWICHLATFGILSK